MADKSIAMEYIKKIKEILKESKEKVQLMDDEYSRLPWYMWEIDRAKYEGKHG